MKPNVLALALVFLLALFLFGWLFWPTPFLYYRIEDSSSVFRVNRFSGRTEFSTDHGWKTQEEINAEATAR